MDAILRIVCITTIVVCGAAAQNKGPIILQPLDTLDLEAYNCNNAVDGDEPCATECGLNQCYRTSSKTGTRFPEDGFCSVFNTSHQLLPEVDWYTVSGRICLPSPYYPQGTGILFNYQNHMSYEVVFKMSQSSSVCYVGYVEDAVVHQTSSFECGSTTSDQWHRYTVTVYRGNTFEASFSTQAGSSMTSERFSANYNMSTRGGTLITNDGSPGKVLQFDEISMTLTYIDECASSPCSPGGSCINEYGFFTCICFPGYTGVQCETDINECASSPCGSGGSCTDGIASYICTCYAGYTGVYCETDVNECASSPCQNGGSCNNLINTYTCSCVPAYKGNNCETYRCRSGYEFFENSCFKVDGSANLDWFEARGRCNSDGADLVTIDSRAEDDFLTSKMQRSGCGSDNDGWIGLTDNNDEGNWKWIATGQRPSYTHWQSGQPDDEGRGDGDEDCGNKRFSWGTWYDFPCSQDGPECWICEDNTI